MQVLAVGALLLAQVLDFEAAARFVAPLVVYARAQSPCAVFSEPPRSSIRELLVSAGLGSADNGQN